jgi:hypothetical protein
MFRSATAMHAAPSAELQPQPVSVIVPLSPFSGVSMSLIRSVVLSAAATAAFGVPAATQEVDTTPPLEIGAVAPDFALPGATRYGRLAEDVRLSDYRGQTVVLAFFFRARTRG